MISEEMKNLKEDIEELVEKYHITLKKLGDVAFAMHYAEIFRQHQQIKEYRFEEGTLKLSGEK